MRRGPGRGPLVALLLAFSALTALYAGATPPVEGPDAGAHLRFVGWFQEGWRRPALNAENASRSHQIVSQPPLFYGLAAAWLRDVPIGPGLRLDVPNPQWPGDSPRVAITPPDAQPGDFLPWRLAALASWWGGLLAIVATWGLTRSLVRGQPFLALAAAGVVGLNPQFLFAAGTVTNDTWAAGSAALAAWLAARAARERAHWARAWLAAGLALGLAGLTKYNALVVVVPVGLMWLRFAWRRPPRQSLLAASLLGLGAGIVAGPWFGENLWRWGELVPTRRLVELFPQLTRQPPSPWRAEIARLPWLYRSYWGVYGHGVVPEGAYQRVTDGLVVLAAAGLVILVLRLVRDRRLSTEAWAGCIAAAWLIATLAALLSFMRTTPFGIHGRLLLGAAPAVGLLMGLGWAALAPRRWRPAALAAVPPLYAALALWQGLYLRQAYALPAPVPATIATDRPLAARFSGGIEVVGLDLPSGNVVTGGEAFPVRLTLRASQPITGFARVFVHLSDAHDATFGRWDGAPAGGRHPTAQWRPGETFQDTVWLSVPPVDASRVVTLSLGFYDPESGGRWPLLGADGRAVADRATAGHAWVQPAAGTGAVAPSSAAAATWANGITLQRADVTHDATGAPSAVATHWSARLPVHQDLTVFVQVLDAADRVIAQVDRRPQGGAWPTDAWPPGRAVTDTYRLGAATGAWDRVILGLYGPDGRRVPVVGGGDYLVVAERRHSGGRQPVAGTRKDHRRSPGAPAAWLGSGRDA